MRQPLTIIARLDKRGSGIIIPNMKQALIIIDYQNDFVDGSLGFPGAEALEERIISLIEKAKADGAEILFTQDTHGCDYMHTEEGRNLPVPHCLKGSEGWKIRGKLGEIAQQSKVFEKPTFPSAELFDYLRKDEYSKIGLCGLDTSICVIANAVMAKAAQPNAHIVFYRFASGSGDPEAEETAVRAMKRLHIEVVEHL